MSLTNIILKNLIENREFGSKAATLLQTEYFDSRLDAAIFDSITDFIASYNDLPTMDALKVVLRDKGTSYSSIEINDKIESLRSLKDNNNLDWLLDSTEKFCKDAAIRNAILRSVDIVDGNDKEFTEEAIPDLLKSALSVGFDKHIGHDYFDDAEKRYDVNTDEVSRILTGIPKIDRITRGGLKPKTLNIFYAGCVHPDTPIIIKLDDQIQEIPISDVKNLLEEGKELFVYSPDGWVKITAFVDKGMFEEYSLVMETGETVWSNANHLYETTLGWYSADQLASMEEPMHIRTKTGFHLGDVHHNPSNLIPIVDITVDHPNHRYYTNGVSSHNTGVGKTHLLCALSSNILKQGRNVLYISMEMHEEAIGERVDANLLDTPMGKIYTEKSSFLSEIQTMRKKTHGTIKIKEYPTCGASTADFAKLLDELQLKKNFTPDVIMIDYMSICKSKRYKVSNSNSYTYVKGISEEFRELASIYKVPVITGAQVNRQGYQAESIEMTDAAESFGGNFVADLVLGLNMDKSNPDNSTMIVNQMKNRYGPIGDPSRFLIKIDRAKMKVLSEDEFEKHQENVVKSAINPKKTKFL